MLDNPGAFRKPIDFEENLKLNQAANTSDYYNETESDGSRVRNSIAIEIDQEDDFEDGPLSFN